MSSVASPRRSTLPSTAVPVRAAVDHVDAANATVVPPKAIPLFCFDLGQLSPLLQLLLLSLGVFVFFMANGFIEEYIFLTLAPAPPLGAPAPDKDTAEHAKFPYGWFLTAFELICFFSFAVMERASKGAGPVFRHRAPLWRHASVAAAMTASRGLTNVSLQYLNYPTQVIFKSLKLLTVLIGSVVCLGKRHGTRDYIAALLLVTSAILFTLGDNDAHVGGVNHKGLVIVLVSLVADAAHSNMQAHVLQTLHAELAETVLYTNLFASLMTLGVTTVNGQLWLGIELCRLQPWAVGLFVFRASLIYVGVVCFVTLIKRFGVVLATSVTTVRKVLTVLVSFVIYTKPFSMKYVYGTALFCAGVILNICQLQERERKKKEKKQQTQAVDHDAANGAAGSASPTSPASATPLQYVAVQLAPVNKRTSPAPS